MSTFAFNGSNYQIINIAKTWIDAKTYAESINGSLAVVNSQAENDAIIANAINFISSSNSAEDGATRDMFGLGAQILSLKESLDG